MERILEELLSTKQFLVKLRSAAAKVRKTGYEWGFTVWRRNNDKIMIGKVVKADNSPSTSWKDESLLPKGKKNSFPEGIVHFHPQEDELIVPSSEDLEGFVPLILVPEEELIDDLRETIMHGYRVAREEDYHRNDLKIVKTCNWQVIGRAGEKEIELLFLLPVAPVTKSEILYWEEIGEEIIERTRLLELLLEFNIKGEYLIV